MNIKQNKLMGLEEAVKKYVRDGSHISIGGFTINRNPMAAVYEIIRQKIRNLHLYAHSNGQGVDELIGAGCVKKIEIAYGGNGKFAATCIRFRKAVQDGVIDIEDYSNYQMTLRFLAGSMGIPFLPVRSSLGTDIVKKWGFSKEKRLKDPKLPDDKLITMNNPFGDWLNTKKLVLVPAINTDVTIIHVQKADKQGTGRIKGLSFADIEQAKSAKQLILTCEELIETDEIRISPDQNQIPFINVDAVVHVPHGAYPTACYKYYDYDPVYLNNYAVNARDEELYQQYLEKYIYNIKDHEEFINLIGKEHINTIKANFCTGYATDLIRS